MRPLNHRYRFFPFLVVLFACLPITQLLQATPNDDDDLQSSYERFWTGYAAALKKVKEEKNNQKAAQLVDQMKKDILPRFGQLIKSNEEWKKIHTPIEIKKMENWVSANSHASEVASLQTELMVRSAKEGEALGKAFRDYMQAMVSINKIK